MIFRKIIKVVPENLKEILALPGVEKFYALGLPGFNLPEESFGIRIGNRIIEPGTFLIKEIDAWDSDVINVYWKREID